MNSAVFQLMKGTLQLGANVLFLIIPRGECKLKIGQRKLERDRKCSYFEALKQQVAFQEPSATGTRFLFSRLF